MSTWNIHRINTATGQVTMRSDSGETVDLVIPPEHRSHPRSQEFIRAECARIAAAPMARTESDPVKKAPIIAIIILAAVLGILAILKQKGIL